LQSGRDYYIFATTPSSLYRHDINDVIRVEDRYHRNPLIVFLRKGRGMTNITGEKVSVNQVIAAVEAAAQDTAVVVAHFRAEADHDNGRYVLRAEVAGPLEPNPAQALLDVFDRRLQELNIEYKAKRVSGRLRPPVLHVMREGWYDRQRREQVASGKRAFQAKTELLSPMKQATATIRPELERVYELQLRADED